MYDQKPAEFVIMLLGGTIVGVIIIVPIFIACHVEIDYVYLTSISILLSISFISACVFKYFCDTKPPSDNYVSVV